MPYYDIEDRNSEGSMGGGSGSDGSGRSKGVVKAIGRGLSDAGQKTLDRSTEDAARSIGPVQYKSGGRVRKTGPAILHKNERVISAGKRKKVERMMKRSKMRMKAGR